MDKCCRILPLCVFAGTGKSPVLKLASPVFRLDCLTYQFFVNAYMITGLYENATKIYVQSPVTHTTFFPEVVNLMHLQPLSGLFFAEPVPVKTGQRISQGITAKGRAPGTEMRYSRKN